MYLVQLPYPVKIPYHWPSILFNFFNIIFKFSGRDRTANKKTAVHCNNNALLVERKSKTLYIFVNHEDMYGDINTANRICFEYALDDDNFVCQNVR